MFAVQCAMLKGTGGVFTSMFHYARMFEANGVRSVCVHRGPHAERLRDAGLDVIEAPSTLTLPFFPLTPDFARLRFAIRARGGDPDFFLAHSDLAMPGLKRMFPRAIATTRCHSDKTKNKKGADLVITLNPSQDAMVRRELPGQRIALLGNPFVPPANDPGPRDEDGPGGRIRFNFLGRVEQVKDPITLIKAFGAANLPVDTELRIIGAGSQMDEAKECASAIAKPVEFAGWLNQPFATFDRGDIVVFPSEWESYSWVIREAMHHGVPIIASDIDVHRWASQNGECAMLFPMGDSQALAASLERACRDTAALRAMSELGREMLTRDYSARGYWTRLSNELAEVRHARGA